jgi:hypothetical protein
MRVSGSDQAAPQHRQALGESAHAYPIFRIAYVRNEGSEPFFQVFIGTLAVRTETEGKNASQGLALRSGGMSRDQATHPKIFNAHSLHYSAQSRSRNSATHKKRPRLSPGPYRYHNTSYRKIRT